MSAPSHHAPGGGFRNPWPGAGATERGLGDLLRWRLERARSGVAPAPAPGALPPGRADPARPRSAPGELRITWVGHSTLLAQLPGWNVLTDPVWSERASPVAWVGPARLAPPGLPWDELPELDAVVLSHDHYDHLDEPTVLRLHERFGERVLWLAPLGFADWLGRRGIARVRELDWWQEARLEAPGRAALRAVAAPAQHWSRRSPLERRRARLWCSWALAAGGASLFFAGDTGFFPAFPEIGARLGPFTVAALPIGAYDPRWFMRGAHMDPEEAVQAFVELGGARGGTLLPIHWGTFRLTDEPVLEPPERLRAAWTAAGLPPEALTLLRHGQTLCRHAGTK